MDFRAEARRRLLDTAFVIVLPSAIVLACHKSEPSGASGGPATTTTAAGVSGAASAVNPNDDTSPSAARAVAPRVDAPRPGVVDLPEPAVAPNLRPDAGAMASLRAIFDAYGMRGYPGLSHLCGQRVYRSNGGHLTWDAFTSDDPPKDLVDHYRSLLGEAGFERNGEGGVWRLPAGNPHPNRVLTISSASEMGPHEACAKKPAAGAKSVLLLSREE